MTHRENTGAPVYQTRAGRIGVASATTGTSRVHAGGCRWAERSWCWCRTPGTVGEWPEGLFEAEMQVTAFQNGYFVGLATAWARQFA